MSRKFKVTGIFVTNFRKSNKQLKGVLNVLFKLKVLGKIGFCRNRLKKMDECSLARARKSLATDRIFGFWSLVALSFFMWCVHNV